MKDNEIGHDDSYQSAFDDDYWDDEESDGTKRDRARVNSYRPSYREPGRKRAAQRDGAFNVVLWLLEGATGMVEELRHNDLGLPEDFWVHAYAARREGLMAMRAALDQFIDDSEDDQNGQSDRQQRRSRRGGINVDF